MCVWGGGVASGGGGGGAGAGSCIQGLRVYGLHLWPQTPEIKCGEGMDRGKYSGGFKKKRLSEHQATLK